MCAYVHRDRDRDSDRDRDRDRDTRMHAYMYTNLGFFSLKFGNFTTNKVWIPTFYTSTCRTTGIPGGLLSCFVVVGEVVLRFSWIG